MKTSHRPCLFTLLALSAALAASGARAQTKPPKAQLWLDVSTGGMAGMPEMELPAGMGGMLGLMGGGASGASTSYGQARGMHVMPTRVLDIAFYNSLKPGAEAADVIPPGMRMGDSLPLLPPRPQAGAREREPGEVPQDVERPRGRILIYWGCGETVRAGQPRVIDLNRAEVGGARPTAARRSASSTCSIPTSATA
jgi:hypothetical protein